ncbi:DUF305 domain-containing protein [Kribbella sandramycini]|uniref:DUF305 domain-containing protein n=1 Tax=Kribbella sandramycini TaxID=60450 RepID=A0A7Y4NXU0_9ACTN|nr:uncharacterized protein (DUF305 family) [Kribbella sandramycini]NOL40232.1 DUF305 domain-containing protein [Kribbella sandramycini]
MLPSAPIIVPGTPGGPNRTVTAVPTSQATVDPDDVKFLRDMMVHHQQAVQMTELARTRATNASVKSLAERIRVGQKPEINAMRVLLTERGQQPPDLSQSHHADHVGMPGMASPAQLADLEKASGAAFDKLFLELMIKHHEGAVAMGYTAVESGSDLRVNELAQEVNITQTKEILTMRKLQTQL